MCECVCIHLCPRAEMNRQSRHMTITPAPAPNSNMGIEVLNILSLAAVGSQVNVKLLSFCTSSSCTFCFQSLLLSLLRPSITQQDRSLDLTAKHILSAAVMISDKTKTSSAYNWRAVKTKIKLVTTGDM